MSTTGDNEFRSVTPENLWHVLRAIYGKQMHAASVSVLLIRDDGTVKFETVSMPTQTSIDAAIAQEQP
jgi:hypothetical protein